MTPEMLFDIQFALKALSNNSFYQGFDRTSSESIHTTDEETKQIKDELSRCIYLMCENFHGDKFRFDERYSWGEVEHLNMLKDRHAALQTALKKVDSHYKGAYKGL